jgi:hypothetical protein
MAQLNVQSQEKIEWKRQLIVAKAYLDQLERSQGLPVAQIAAMRKRIENAKTSKNPKKLKGMASSLEKSAKSSKNGADMARLRVLAGIMKQPEM